MTREVDDDLPAVIQCELQDEPPADLMETFIREAEALFARYDNDPRAVPYSGKC